MELNLELFRWMKFDSNACLNDEMGGDCEDRLEGSKLGRISSDSEIKTCEIDRDLSSGVEVTCRTLHSSLDEVLPTNAEKIWSEWRQGVMIPFSRKTYWKDIELFLEDYKIVLTLNYFLIAGPFFDAECSAHDSMDRVDRILGKEGEDTCFAFKVDALLDSEGLGKVN